MKVLMPMKYLRLTFFKSKKILNQHTKYILQFYLQTREIIWHIQLSAFEIGNGNCNVATKLKKNP